MRFMRSPDFSRGVITIRKLGLGQCTFAVLAILVSSWYAQGPSDASQGPGPQISVADHTYTQQELFQRNVGTPNDQNTQFPPHKIIGNVYYVGTVSLASFLIVTPQGNILINSMYERDVPVIQKSVEQLGFKFLNHGYIPFIHAIRSEEHTSELQSQFHLVCRLLLEKKK